MSFKQFYIFEEPHVDFGKIDGNDILIDFYAEKDPEWVTKLIDIFSGKEISDSDGSLFKIDSNLERDQITDILLKNPFFIKSLKNGLNNLDEKDLRRFKFVIPRKIRDLLED